MGDIMAPIGCHEWEVNMMGISLENMNQADTAKKKQEMKKNTYESNIIWQHSNSESLYNAIWLGNIIICNLSNFRSPKVVEGGIQRKRKVNENPYTIRAVNSQFKMFKI